MSMNRIKQMPSLSHLPALETLSIYGNEITVLQVRLTAESLG